MKSKQSLLSLVVGGQKRTVTESARHASCDASSACSENGRGVKVKFVPLLSCCRAAKSTSGSSDGGKFNNVRIFLIIQIRNIRSRLPRGYPVVLFFPKTGIKYTFFNTVMQMSAVKCTLLRKLRIDIGLQHRLNIDKVMLLDILFHVVDIFRLHSYMECFTNYAYVSTYICMNEERRDKKIIFIIYNCFFLSKFRGTFLLFKF